MLTIGVQCACFCVCLCASWQAEARRNSLRVRRLEAELALTQAQRKSIEEAMDELRMEVKWRYAYKEIRRLRKLGSGTFGDVWLAYDYRQGTPIAVKKLKAERLTKAILRKFREEVQLMSGLAHPNITRFVGMARPVNDCGVYALSTPGRCAQILIAPCPPAFRCATTQIWEEPHLCLLLEYVERGALRPVLEADAALAEPALLWAWPKLHVLRDVAAALGYLHTREPKVIHRDIKHVDKLTNCGVCALSTRVPRFSL